MFDEVPDQFHQFITPRTSPLPLHHLPFPLHGPPNATNPNTFPPFDPYNPSHHHHHHHQLQLHQVQPNLLHPSLHHHHHHQAPSSTSTHSKHEEKEENSTTVPMNFEIERDQRQQLPEQIDPWTNDEVLALLRIRSSMESWFPELTWEHVSRKLAELGYKRSAEKCKEKFEEESRYFTNINYGKISYRFLSELEEVYQGDQNPHHHHQVESDKTQQQVEKPSDQGQEDKILGHALEQEGSWNIDPSVTTQKEHEELAVEKTTKERKRKKGSGGGGGRFEMFKGFCESIVHKMMEQQEEMHNKLLEDMVRRDEEKFAKEEAWKKQEMERMNKELEMMAQEQAIAGDRQANVIEFLKKFAPEIQSLVGVGDYNGRDKLVKVTSINDGSNSNSTTATTTTASSPLHSPNPNPSTGENSLLLQPTPSSAVILNLPNGGASSSLSSRALMVAENPSSGPVQDALQVASSTTTTTSAPPAGKNPSSSLNNDPIETNSVANKATSNRVSATTHEKDDIGRRWPKDEVLALINLRCNSRINNNNNNNEDNNNKEGNKVPLWERISQGMLELGYKRSAKRCKEKWENINKYFRKTKDTNKKRSLDSRTCPYFHHLSNLYSQGKLVLQPERQENQLNSPPVNSHGKMVTDQTQLTEPSQVGSGGFSVEVDHGGEKTLMQAPSLDFDQF